MKKRRVGIIMALSLCCCLSAGCAGESCQDKTTGALTSLLPMDSIYEQAQGLGYQGTMEEFTALLETVIQEGIQSVDLTTDNKIALKLQGGKQVVVGEFQLRALSKMKSAYQEAKAFGYQGSYGEFVKLCEDVMADGVEHVLFDQNDKIVLFFNNGESVIIGEVHMARDNPSVVEGGIMYALNDAGNGYVVVGIEDMEATEVHIPAVCQNKPVTAIGASAFADMKKLETVRIGSNVQEIGSGAFYGCQSINYIIVPARVEYISSTAFTNSSLSSLYLERNERPSSYQFTTALSVYLGSQWHYDAHGNPVID